MLQAYFEVLNSLLVEVNLQPFKIHQLTSALSYQLLPLATSQLVGNNKKFALISWGV